ncbi:MAG: tyrosine-type recombinase/integrase, partial [Candidatus Latescibacterota bacterium]
TEASEAEVPVPGILLDALRDHKVRQAEIRLKKGDKWRDHDLIFPTGKGTPVSHIASEKWHPGIVEAAGLRYVSLHTLRKTGATILETEIGASRQEVQAALRHKRPTVTDVYVAYQVEQRRHHIDRLAALITVDLPTACPQTRSILAAFG